jgi:hypothetical protein
VKRILLLVSVFIGLASLLIGISTVRGDAVSEMTGFSVFGNVDLAQLAKMDVKTAHGPPMNSPRLLSVQSCYVVPRTPAQEITTLRQWVPTQHRELKIFLHNDLPPSPGPASFSGLRKPPDNASVRSLVAGTLKLSSDLQISQDEAKKFSPGGTGGGLMPDSVFSFWTNLLSARARAFASGGSEAQPSYDHTGRSVKPNEELDALLRQQNKIRQQFAGFIATTGIGRGAGSQKPELYWELLDVDGDGVLTLGAAYNRPGSGGTYQAADTLYYASGGYYVALTFFQMWPVQVEGRSSTLVWRGDLISAASLESLHGVERLASESAMMKDITKAVTLYRRDTSSR